MLKELKFVQGSIAKKDLLPSLTHFRIEDKRVYGYNGKLALSAPIEFDINCIPKAVPLIKAIDRCEDAVQLGLTPSGKLSVKSGKFRTYIECVEGETPHVVPEGDEVNIDGQALIEALAALEPLISTDAARPWSNGVLFDNSSAYATNNVVIGQYWLGSPFPVRICVPRDAVKEMLRIKEAPCRFQMTENSLTVHYEDGRWLRTNLINSQWPNVDRVLSNPSESCKEIPEEFFTALDSVKPFVDPKFGRIVLQDGTICTHHTDQEDGAIYELPWITNNSSFRIEMLQKLKGLATHLDLSMYPNPCCWYGGKMRGVIVGLHWLEGR